MDATLQVNIDATLKKRGDEVLRENGMSASAAVQALWQELATTQELPAFLRQAMQESPDAKLRPFALGALPVVEQGALSDLLDGSLGQIGLSDVLMDAAEHENGTSPRLTPTIKNVQDYRFLGEADRKQLEDLIELVEASLPNTLWWPPIRQKLRDHFFDGNWVRFIGHFDEGRLLATAGLFLEPTVYDHLAEAIGLDPAKTAEIGRCMVRPSRRGSNLMLAMSKRLVDCAVMHERDWIIAAVHPDNISGCTSLERLGMEEKGQILQDGIYHRSIYAMHL